MSIEAELDHLLRRLDTESDTQRIREDFEALMRRSPFIKAHLISVGALDSVKTLHEIPARLAERERKDKLRLKAKEDARRRYLDAIGIEQELAVNFLKADGWLRRKLQEQPPPDGDGKAIFAAYLVRKMAFVRSWLVSNTPRSKDGKSDIPDDEQIEAISSVDGHIQVVARAGSGKTTTLVHRVLFLLKHCRVPPDKILVLAFNKKAALEVRRRLLKLTDPTAEQAVVGEIEQRIKAAPSKSRFDRSEIEAHVVDAVAAERNIALPHVMTFHALAYAIVRPEESLLHDGPDGESRELSRVLQQVIDDHLREPVFKGKIRELMLAHFRADWERIIEGRYDQTQEEFLRYRRSLPRVSVDGQHVKSYGEKLIADFLFEHGVEYKYERNHWWGDINYRPDFTIFKTP